MKILANLLFFVGVPLTVQEMSDLSREFFFRSTCLSCFCAISIGASLDTNE